MDGVSTHMVPSTVRARTDSAWIAVNVPVSVSRYDPNNSHDFCHQKYENNNMLLCDDTQL